MAINRKPYTANLFEKYMIDDAFKYLVPALKKTIPVKSGRLRDSIGIRLSKGKFARQAKKSGFFMMQEVRLKSPGVRGNVGTIVVGAVNGPDKPRNKWPALYGHIRLAVDKKFRQQYRKVGRQYKKEFVPRIEQRIGEELGLLGSFGDII